MQYAPLGRTGMTVSRICLGTMTFGRQNTQDEAFAQMDYALDQGVDFFDAAEMYPVPQNRDTAGRTEEIIGNWMQVRGTRDKVKIATKIVGPGGVVTRDTGNGLPFDAANIAAAVDGSLKRLKIDTIDLYQLHWPERKTNYFGRLGYRVPSDDAFTPFDEVLATLEGLIQAGKIRAAGISNESAWGMSEWLKVSEREGAPRMASIQNPYSLLNRSFEVGCAEIAVREDCGLLAYSPLAFGVLSGKYLDGAAPEGSRLALFPEFQRYVKPKGVAATRTYVEIARNHGLDPAQMALAFVNQQPWVTSNIVGATTMDQLKANIASIKITLNEAVLEDIETAHDQSPYPCP